MILVDTSVFINFLRAREPDPLTPIIESGVPSLESAALINFHCRKAGITIRSTVDCLIAQTAIENNLELLHDDSDFDNMAKVISQLRVRRA